MTRGSALDASVHPPPAAAATPDEPAPPLSLAVGDLVVYASHGIGRVDRIRAGRANEPETVVLSFESGLTVTLPLDRANDALRPLSDAKELDDVGHALSASVPATSEPWTTRQRTLRDTVAAGKATGLAEIVREGLQRERSVAGGNGRPTGPRERELYLQARRLLAAEIAACRGIDATAADAWIVQQISHEEA